MIQPQRLSISDPLLRIAFGCDAFLRQSLSDRSWALLATRMARSHPTVGLLVRGRLSDDLRDALDKSPQAGLTPELGVEVIIGVVLQVAAAIGEGRFDDRVRPEAIRCVLAAIGVGRRDAASIVARLARVRGSVPRDMLKGRKSSRRLFERRRIRLSDAGSPCLVRTQASRPDRERAENARRRTRTRRGLGWRSPHGRGREADRSSQVGFLADAEPASPVAAAASCARRTANSASSALTPSARRIP